MSKGNVDLATLLLQWGGKNGDNNLMGSTNEFLFSLEQNT